MENVLGFVTLAAIAAAGIYLIRTSRSKPGDFMVHRDDDVWLLPVEDEDPVGETAESMTPTEKECA